MALLNLVVHVPSFETRRFYAILLFQFLLNYDVLDQPVTQFYRVKLGIDVTYHKVKRDNSSAMILPSAFMYACLTEIGARVTLSSLFLPVCSI